MNQTLSPIDSLLKSMNRTTSSTPILDLMTNEEISAMEANRAKSEVRREKDIEIHATSTPLKVYLKGYYY